MALPVAGPADMGLLRHHLQGKMHRRSGLPPGAVLRGRVLHDASRPRRGRRARRQRQLPRRSQPRPVRPRRRHQRRRVRRLPRRQPRRPRRRRRLPERGQLPRPLQPRPGRRRLRRHRRRLRQPGRQLPRRRPQRPRLLLPAPPGAVRAQRGGGLERQRAVPAEGPGHVHPGGGQPDRRQRRPGGRRERRPRHRLQRLRRLRRPADPRLGGVAGRVRGHFHRPVGGGPGGDYPGPGRQRGRRRHRQRRAGGAGDHALRRGPGGLRERRKFKMVVRRLRRGQLR